MTALDRRLHAYRDDLADAGLRERVSALDYAESRPARICVPVADLLRLPRADAGLDTQVLHGREVRVFEEAGGWAWVQAAEDGYVGYLDAAAIAEWDDPPTHRVAVPRTFVYAAPDLKSPRRVCHSLGALVRIRGTVEERGTRYALLASGEAMIAAHLDRIGADVADFVAVAESLVATPYLWGGASAFGIDCSGLVQLSMLMAGRSVLRDTDMQAGTIGTSLDGLDFGALRRGDLVFWKGHVGIMTDGQTLLHANGHTMTVAAEPLQRAVERIGYLYGAPTSIRRP